MQISVSKILEQATKNLTDRQREVVLARFGLWKTKIPETLEAIGKRYEVTRERVRQIESVSLGEVRAALATQKSFGQIIELIKNALKNAGGVLKEDALMGAVQKSAKDISKNHLALFAHATGDFFHIPEDREYHGRYFLGKEDLKTATQFVTQWTSELEAQRAAVLVGEYSMLFKNFLKQKNVSSVYAENYLASSKLIHQSPFGVVGLADWPEIKPRTIRDRIYLILYKKAKPLHFVDIAKEINVAKFDTKIALASTVHNELIKDDRFVLVGRGLYGLKEHGFEAGTAKEVIHRILKKHGPMNSKQLVEAVQKERFFKENTILVNLQNREIFLRSNEGVYKVREA